MTPLTVTFTSSCFRYGRSGLLKLNDVVVPSPVNVTSAGLRPTEDSLKFITPESPIEKFMREITNDAV